MLDKVVHRDITELVGNTPVVELGRIFKGYDFRVIAKMDLLNPGGSVKDRVGVEMVEDAEKNGIIKPGDTLIESTSGNTGIGIALAAAVKGYKAIFVIPDKMSGEKIRMLKAYGAKVIVIPTGLPAENPESYYGVARRLAKEIPHSLYLNQYENQSNPEAHYRKTAPEILEQVGPFDYFITTMGTGGTISGCSKYFKEHVKGVKCIGIDPEGSILGEYFHTGKIVESRVYKVEGIGEDMIPKTMWFQYLDDVVKINDAESFRYARMLAKVEGILGGGSSGSTIAGIMKYAEKIKKGSVVVTILPDRGDRYLTKFYSEQWLIENGFARKDYTVGRVADMANDMHEIFSVTPKTPVAKALGIMEKYRMEFLPVYDSGRNYGSIRKGELLKKVVEDRLELSRPVLMHVLPPFPDVRSGDPVSVLFSMLREHEAVIIDSRIFYTREDLLKLEYGDDLFEV